MIRIIVICLIGMGTAGMIFAQKPYRVGTSVANFLEIGYGSSSNAMGDACVSNIHDLSASYWNPAGLAFIKQNEAQFIVQPWVAGINSVFAGVGIQLANAGTFSLGFFQVDYGNMDVTNLAMPEGTGEKFSAADYSLSLSFGRRLAEWFSFGATTKYVSSMIWHCRASAMALDLGVIVNTNFLSPTTNRLDGLTIGMSISNYGTKMKYDGMDLMNPIDINLDENGNYRDVPGQFNLQDWELPLIFRIGISVNPIVKNNQRFTIAIDALHPNNNSESVNVGAQYEIIVPTFGAFYLRSGYKALFLQNSEYGLTFGAGLNYRLMANKSLKIDYSYRNIGALGNAYSYTVGILF